MSPRRRLDAAAKYLVSQSVLSVVALGGVTAAGLTYPHSAVVLAPVALALGTGLGYGWRDAFGDYRGTKALARLRAAQAERIAQLKRQTGAGTLSPDQLAQLKRKLTGATAAPQPEEEKTP